MSTSGGNTTDVEQPGISACDCGSGLHSDDCCLFPNRNALNAPVYAYWAEPGMLGAMLSGEETQATPQIIAAGEHFELPALFPAQINFQRQKLYFVKVTRDSLQQSLYLDPMRIKASCVIESDLDFVAEQADQLERMPCSVVFDSAFCGSTLLTRAFDALYDVCCLREPDILSNVYHHAFLLNKAELGQSWLDRSMRMLARRFEPQQRVLIKANDYVNGLIRNISSHYSDTPMLYLYVPLEEFYLACSKTPNTIAWVKQRVQGLRSVISELLPGIHDASIDPQNCINEAAIYWSYNLALYLKAYEAFPNQLMSIDFNQLLAHPNEALDACAGFLQLQAREDVEPEPVLNRLFGSYSKKLSTEQRTRNIQQSADVLHLHEISQSLLEPLIFSTAQALPGEWDFLR